MKPFQFVLTFDFGQPFESQFGYRSNTLKEAVEKAFERTSTVKVSSVALSRYGIFGTVTLDCEGDTGSYPFSPVVTACLDALLEERPRTKLVAHTRI